MRTYVYCVDCYTELIVDENCQLVCPECGKIKIEYTNQTTTDGRPIK
jgi:predicted RNA-binding Zn-ribbon protein involved in translation (DUF1610 family)